MALRLAEKPVEPARRLFGTDGIRGTANVYPMTGELMLQLGRAVAYLIKRGNHRHRVVIGKDTRLSGYMLETALASGLCSMGSTSSSAAAAYAGHLQPDPLDARRCRRGDQCVAQSLSRQRDQVLQRGRLQAAGRGRGGDRGPDRQRQAQPSATDGDQHRQGLPHRRRSRPLHRLREEHVPGAPDAGRLDHRGGLRARGSLPGCARGAGGAGRAGDRDREPARRQEHQPRVRGAPPGDDVQGGEEVRAHWASRWTATPTA